MEPKNSCDAEKILAESQLISVRCQIKSSIRDIICQHYPNFHPVMTEALAEATTKDLTQLIWRFKDTNTIE